MKTMNDHSQEIMTEFKVRDLHPIPAWHFLITRTAFWSLAVGSVVSGAVALSIAFYIFFDSEGIPTSTLLNSSFSELFESAPIFWLIASALFLVSAYLSIRHTKRGYRYGTLKIMLILFTITVILGGILAALDFGSVVHYYLTGDLGFYEALRQALSNQQ